MSHSDRPLTVGVIGGGQLARMMIPAAIDLGIEIRVLGESAECSASQAVTAIGEAGDADAVLAFAASDIDAITFDHEHVPQNVLAALVAAGAKVQPGPDALLYAQDKLRMRSGLGELGVPMPAWTAAATTDEADAFIETHGGRAVAKTPRGGYDGKGVRVVEAASEVAEWFERFDEVLIEELVPFRRELSQLVARRPSGEMRRWPLVETIQKNGVCAEVLAPAPDADEGVIAAAANTAETIAEGLGVTGVLAVELFETTDGRVLVNELAMRPHNSGHWTQNASVTGQFEQHLRAVLDLPLGETAMTAPAAVMVNLLGGPDAGNITGRLASGMQTDAAAKIHTYGKASRPGRKVGHVNATGERMQDALDRARAVAARFDG